jgi:hypothetical protein
VLCSRADSIDQLISNLHVTEEERRRLVNLRLDPALLRVVLDFLYRPDFAHSLPPLLALTHVTSDKADDLLVSEQLSVCVCMCIRACVCICIRKLQVGQVLLNFGGGEVKVVVNALRLFTYPKDIALQVRQ